MIDKLTPRALARAVNEGYEALRWLRDRRRRAWAAYEGPDWGKTDDLRPQLDVWEGSPGNLTAQQVKTILAHVAFTNPRADVIATQTGMEFDADLLREAADADAVELELEEKYQEAAVDCILGGLVCHRIGVRAGSDLLKVRDREAEPGALFEEPVDLDDVCWDPTAKRFRQRRWEACRTCVDVDEAIRYAYYGRDREEVDPTELYHPYMATREEAKAMLQNANIITDSGRSSRERVSDTGMGETLGDDPVAREVWIWDVIVFCGDGSTYVMTMLGDEDGVDETAEKFLLVERFDGPARGPLVWFSFLPPGAAICPQSLDALQKDLACVHDALMNKAVRQALRTKQVTIYRPSAHEEMRAFLDADEDEAIAGDPKDFTTVKGGGLMADVVQAAEFVNSWWNDATGGLQQGAGLRDRGQGTATAFQGLMNKVQGWLNFLNRRMESFASRCLQLRMWYRLNDPHFKRILRARLPSTETIDVIYDKDMRRGGFHDYVFRVRAFSGQVQDPVLRAMRTAEVLAAGGPFVTVLELVVRGVLKPHAIRDLARMFDLPELETWVNDPRALMEAMLLQQAAVASEAGPDGLQPPRAGTRTARGFVKGGGQRYGQGGTPLSPLGIGARPPTARPGYTGAGAA